MTPEAPTYVSQRDALFVDIGERQNATQTEIDRLQAEIYAHQRKANETSGWDNTSARAELAQVPPKHQAIAAARLRLRDLDEQRGLATDGRHEKLQTAERHTQGQAFLTAMQTEHRDATAAFKAFITPELRAAAARVIEANKAAHGDSNRYPPIAVAIVNNL